MSICGPWELGGQFEIQSDQQGTVLTVVLPVSEDTGDSGDDSEKTVPKYA
jgi:signal transduction histidine kinase